MYESFRFTSNGMKMKTLSALELIKAKMRERAGNYSVGRFTTLFSIVVLANVNTANLMADKSSEKQSVQTGEHMHLPFLLK
jgi:hypothetical protein